jgi:hypothetical protein
MVRLRIDIEAAAGDPGAVNILLKDERNQTADAEEAAAQHLLPPLRALLHTRFPDGDEARKPVAKEYPSPHLNGATS